MELDNVPQVMFGEVKEQPHFAVGMVQKDPLQRDHVRMFQLAQQGNLATGRHRDAVALDQLQRVLLLVLAVFGARLVHVAIGAAADLAAFVGELVVYLATLLAQLGQEGAVHLEWKIK